jgi:hypothetical protein
MYNTTNKPTVWVGPRPAQSLNVAREMKPLIMKKARDILRMSHTDNVVPSSYSWNPTKPLMSKQTHRADARPDCTATKYGYGDEPGGMTPESRQSEQKVKAMYRKKKKVISLRPIFRTSTINPPEFST